jgi:hypothetical protein
MEIHALVPAAVMVSHEQGILLPDHVPALACGTNTKEYPVCLNSIIPFPGCEQEGIHKVFMKDTYPDIL